jgi:hypothetical protein
VWLAACSSDSTSEPLAIDDIDEAISAVGEHFDADVDFYEINATSDGVNLFVSWTGADESPAVVQARFTRAGGLGSGGRSGLSRIRRRLRPRLHHRNSNLGVVDSTIAHVHHHRVG